MPSMVYDILSQSLEYAPAGNGPDDIIYNKNGISVRLGVNVLNEGVRTSSDATPSVPFLSEYPGAAAAYSLRDLTGAGGPVVRVRRASDNAERDFTASDVTPGGLGAWAGSSPGYVVIWYDQAGSAGTTGVAHDARQSIATEQPLIWDGQGLFTSPSGAPGVYFQGGGTEAEGHLSPIYGYLIKANDEPDTVFMAGTWERGPLFSTDQNRDDNQVIEIAADGDLIISWNDLRMIRNQFKSQYAGPDGLGVYMTFRKGSYSGGDYGVAVRSNGVHVPLSGYIVPYSQAPGPFNSLGRGTTNTGTTYLKGTIGELLIYEADKTAEAPDIEANMNQHWGAF